MPLMKARYLSLTPFILWQGAERPIDWQRRFGRDAPVEVEIGFGNGEFLVHQAQHTPEHDFVGLELEWSSVQRGLRRIAQTCLSNVRLLQADARVALARLFRPQSVQRVLSLFPCPWPKARHARHRLFSRAFLALLNSRLVAHGEVQIVTDHVGYVHWILEQAAGTGFAPAWHSVSPHLSTKYARKWHALGQERFYELWLHKQACLVLPVQEDVTLQIHCVPSFDPEHFQPASVRGDIAVECKDFLFDPKRQKGMVRVFVTEEPLCQDFWIEIAHSHRGWSIRPARGCPVVPTVGVQRALDLVRDATYPYGPRPGASYPS
jgi:tRNA (guanine-N7-)-methyltransferase